VPVALRAVATAGANSTATASTYAPGRPAGNVSGDLLLLSICWSGSTVTLTDPTGWTLFHKTAQTNDNLATYWRSADLSATDTPTLTLSAAAMGVATASAFSGWNGAAPVAANVLGGASGTTITYPAITPGTANDMLVYLTGLRLVSTGLQVTAVLPTGGTGGALTKNTDICNNGAGTANCEQAVIWQQLTAATAVTQQTATVAQSVSSNIEAICITPSAAPVNLLPQQLKKRIPAYFTRINAPTRRGVYSR
jgi:hypothetical protein